MIAGLLGIAAVALFIVWRRHRVSRSAVGPLAGYDTGTRFAGRSPSRFFNHRRTL